jgi:hypothetical protein
VVVELNSVRAAVAKVKNALTGLPPTEAEVMAVTTNRTALKQLINSWMQLPEYNTQTLQFLQLLFQQTQITTANLGELLQFANNGATVPLLLENIKESLARTILALEAEGKPLTETFTTNRFMMTPALMEIYAFMDTRRHNNSGNFTDLLPPQGPPSPWHRRPSFQRLTRSTSPAPTTSSSTTPMPGP